MGTDPSVIAAVAHDVLGAPVTPRRPPLWDGRTAERIAAILAEPSPVWQTQPGPRPSLDLVPESRR